MLEPEFAGALAVGGEVGFGEHSQSCDQQCDVADVDARSLRCGIGAFNKMNYSAQSGCKTLILHWMQTLQSRDASAQLRNRYGSVSRFKIPPRFFDLPNREAHFRPFDCSDAGAPRIDRDSVHSHGVARTTELVLLSLSAKSLESKKPI